MSGSPMGVGIIGAGNIIEQYLVTLTAAPDVEVRFIADLDAERARAKAEQFDVPGWGTPDDLLADPSVELVVNLTVPQAHAEVSLAALESGRHVWSEKPLATTIADARDLAATASRLGLRLGCAPDTFLGTGLQTGLTAIREGQIGTPRHAVAFFQYYGPDQWHPSPEFFFGAGAGPVLDVGPYHVTALVQVFGPVARVTARGVVTRPRRTVAVGPKAGTEFDVTVPSHVTALYEFADGSVADAIFSFDSPVPRVLLEVSGTKGALRMTDPNNFDGTNGLLALDGTEEELDALAYGGSGRGSGVIDIVRSLRDGTPHRASAELALHVLDALLATERSVLTGTTVTVESRVDAADLLPSGWVVGSGDGR
ncbi:MAG: Gfo/Idh/MocA family oxidoreductase [Cellulomonadaceae bacterium]|nr:Gfo/Idh/MocA family oxidoreductase [Cellulomonadaceae bacterium]